MDSSRKNILQTVKQQINIPERIVKKLLGHNKSFLPSHLPETHIRSEFSQYENAYLSLSDHYPINKGGVRKWLDDEFKQFNPELIRLLDKLTTGELRYLNVILVLLAHCYRWQSSPPPDDAADQTQLSLPTGINRLWHEVCQLTDQKQVGSNASLFYWGWGIRGKKGGEPYSLKDLSIEKIESTNCWLGDEYKETLDLWVAIFVMIEASGSLAVNALINAVNAAENNDFNSFTSALSEARDAMHKMVNIFARTIKSTKIDPATWQKIIQPTFAWGINSEEGRLTGASGMQIGSLQAIGILLSIEEKTDIAVQTVDARKYFTFLQQLFLDMLTAKSTTIKQYASKHGLTGKYNECVHELELWRNSHMKRAAMYIESAGTDVNKARISTGLTLPAATNQKQIFIDEMKERIEETTRAKIHS
ncbi:MAG: hypothetical protein KAQ67_13110 [Gammaproteobacteria bacterium]|nr:hypothetical protein [Gammaproteobacteria bacterium]